MRKSLKSPSCSQLDLQMNRNMLSKLAVVALFALATTAGQVAQGAPRKAQMTSKTLALQFTSRLKSENFSAAAQMLDPAMKAAVSTQLLQQTWQSLVIKLGPCKQTLAPTVEKLGHLEIVYVPCVFDSKTLDLKIVVGNMKIVGFFIVSHASKKEYEEAPYVVSNSLADQPAKVPCPAVNLDATWSVPKGDGPFPVVILVHGSGPQDRDESIGSNKPFRDLAHGLASNGIAVLRYEKRTKQSPTKLGVELNKLTVKEETIDDAVAAVNVARQFPKADKAKIFVLGHSLGGMLIPRIAEADPAISGFISLAGNARSITDLLVEQMEYIATLPGENGASAKKQLPTIKQQIAAIKSPELSEATPAKDLMGVPAVYWLDLRSYDPVESMKRVDRPVLFLQGGRDYQVTASGDYRRWQDAMKDKTNCTFKFYPKLSHLFIVGEGMATPEEYLNKTGHVSEQVIRDIADWIKKL